MSQNKLLYRILKDGTFTEAFEVGLSKRFFIDEESAEVFQYIQAHFTEHGKTPSLERVTDKFKTYSFIKTDDSLKELVSDARRHAQYKYTFDLVRNTSLLIKAAHDKGDMAAIMEVGDEAFAVLKKAILAAENDFSQAEDIALNSDKFVERFWAEFDERALNDGLMGIPAPWPTLNIHAQGANKGDLIIIVGRPKTKKSWLITEWSSDTWWRYHKSVLLVSNEIQLMKMANRIISQKAHINYTEIQTAKMQADNKAALQDLLDQMRSHNVPFVVSGNDDDMTAGGVASIEAKIVRYQPDIVFIDGAYLLEDDLGSNSAHEKAGNVIRQLKKLAKRREVPIIITWQFNRNASTAKGDDTNIGLTDRAGQDADLIIGLFQTEDMKLNHEMMMKSIAIREGAPFEYTINCKFQTMDFSEIEDWEPDVEDTDGDESSYTTEEVLF